MTFFRPKFWQEINIITRVLLPFTYLYEFLFKLRWFLTKPYYSSAKTICVGNITVGGGGKTPTIIEIAKFLTKCKKKFCVVSRGYKGDVHGPVFVDINFHNANAVGDEPLLIAKYAPVVVSKNKTKAVQFAEQQGFNYILFDDGLQNPEIFYNLSIVMLDNNLGNNQLLPAGPLRESIDKCIARIDVILSNEDDKSLNTAYDHYQYKIINENPIPPGKLILFAGISSPNKFFTLVKNLNGNIIKEISFPDHYKFSNEEVDNLITLAHEHNATLVTTEKDYVRIPLKFKKDITFLAISFKINQLDKILEKIL